MPPIHVKYKPLFLIAISLLLCGHAANGFGAGYVTPALPRAVPDTTMPMQTGATVTVASDCSDLQSKIDAANYGDTILIPAAATCVGHYILRYKSSGSGWIIIRTAAPDSQLPPSGTRIGPAYSSVMPKLLTPDTAPVITTEDMAHNYRLIGLEIAAGPTAATDPNHENYGLVVIGDPAATAATSLASNIVIDRDYIHCSPTQYCKRGVDMESSNTSVVDSTISEIHNPGQDTQAIESYNGAGPFKITNNFLEAAGENVMFGGADPAITGVTAAISTCSRSSNLVTCTANSTAGLQNASSVISGLAPTDLNGSQVITVTDGAHFTYSSTGPNEVTTQGGYANQGGLVPSDITIEHNYFFKPQNWNTQASDYNGLDYTVKDILELKNAQRVLVEGNVFDHNWGGQGQSGWALELTPRNQSKGCPWCVVQDVTFEYNILQNIEAGANLLSADDPSGGWWSDYLKRILFSNNLWMGGPLQVMDGALLQLLDGGSTYVDTPMADVTFDHNTVFQGGNIFNAGDASGRYMSNFTITNNIFPHNAYGMKADNGGAGTSALNQYFGATWNCTNNVIEGIQLSGYTASQYPPGNFFPASWIPVGFLNLAAGDYHLSSSSPYAGAATDGSNIGADINALDAATAGAMSGISGSAQAPSVAPVPPQVNPPSVSISGAGR